MIAPVLIFFKLYFAAISNNMIIQHQIDEDSSNDKKHTGCLPCRRKKKNIKSQNENKSHTFDVSLKYKNTITELNNKLNSSIQNNKHAKDLCKADILQKEDSDIVSFAKKEPEVNGLSGHDILDPQNQHSRILQSHSELSQTSCLSHAKIKQNVRPELEKNLLFIKMSVRNNGSDSDAEMLD